MDFGFSLSAVSAHFCCVFLTMPMSSRRWSSTFNEIRCTSHSTKVRRILAVFMRFKSVRNKFTVFGNRIEKSWQCCVNNVRKEFSVAVVTHHSTNVPIPMNWRTSSICAAAREQSTNSFYLLFARVKCSDSHFECARVGTFFFCFSPSVFSLVESASLITREKRTAKIVM